MVHALGGQYSGYLFQDYGLFFFLGALQVVHVLPDLCDFLVTNQIITTGDKVGCCLTYHRGQR